MLYMLGEEAKKIFLDLAIICTRSDGIIDEVEDKILQEYCDEMNLKAPEKQLRYDAIIENFTEDFNEYRIKIEKNIYSLDEKASKIAYFELFALTIKRDGSLSAIETDILKRLRKKINERDHNLSTKMKNLAKNIVASLNFVDEIEAMYAESKRS
ncbi:hypothetical protein [Campylobacter geochelonis]|uniref:hypothetical protein n=1 Tax=Campylobacter geochelonis TaxID=1780362 RepID=UPI0013F4F65B|nr:hypothetical protein [Campylobacter geochelonis]